MPDKPFRIQTNAGHRKYLCSGNYYPSVTTVLSATETEASKKSLATWSKNNPGKKEEAAARGTAIHKCCENYIRGLPIDCPSEYLPFWNGMTQYLDWFSEIHWSETPFRKDWHHLRSEDKCFSFVWSNIHKYAGTPDLIGEIGGVKVIADFKTSNGPYSSVFPERGDRLGFGGFRKFTKCAQQLAAYRLGLEERTGFRCEAALIIVSTEETTQGIFIDSDQLNLHESRFIKRAAMFHEMYGENDSDSEDCGSS